MGSVTQHKVPVIDFHKENLDPHSSCWISTSEHVVRALEDYGCFIVNYDEFPLELHEAIFGASQKLFDLPIQTKVLNTSDTLTHGYAGQHPIAPLYEALGIEHPTTPQGVQKFTNLLWPNGNDSFCEIALSYSKIAAKLEQTVMRMVSQSYGIEKDYEKILRSLTYLLRLIKYRKPRQNENNVGIASHTDKTFMSIIHQHQVKGLEIQTKEGEWLPIDLSSPSSFFVLVGDVCMAWTNGRIESPEHRVILPEGIEERYSLGLFSFVRDSIVRVPEELVDDEHPLQYKPFDHLKLLQFFSTKDGKVKIVSKYDLKAYCGV
ncbi:hypothetical protein ACH5RR_008142 [Cinchona calisaya]|uniref:Fe2OG dioxygenase domain-containing protein n=1 Tax=Cinchona calisaya TaxID=153742 RepID=A0ABD3AE60_9GENT